MYYMDWVVRDKREGATAVTPEDTAGAKRLNKDDPETVEVFRRSYDAAQKELKDPGPAPVQEPPPKGLGRIRDILTSGDEKRELHHQEATDAWRVSKTHYERWTGPFEDLLDQYAGRITPPVMIATADGKEGARGRSNHVSESDYAFGVNILQPEFNAVAAYGVEALGEESDLLLLGMESKKEILAFAGRLESILNAYKSSGRDQDELNIEEVEHAIRWLRFWGNAGHTIETEGLTAFDLEDGTRIVVETC